MNPREKYRQIITSLRTQHPGWDEAQMQEEALNELSPAELEQVAKDFGPNTPGFADQALTRKRYIEGLAANDEKLRAEAEAKKKAETEGLFNTRVQEEAQKIAENQLAQKLNDIFGRIETQGVEKIERQFIPARQKLIAEEAALGRLTSPTSITNLSKLDEQKNIALGELFGGLSAQRARGELDVAGTIQTLLAGEREAERRGKEFQSELGLRRDMLAQQKQEAEADRQLKRLLGFADIESKKTKSKDTTLDDVSTGVNIATGLFGKGKSGGLFF